MVYTVSVRKLSFKQDLSNYVSMLGDQQATYAILKYAYDVPVHVRDNVLEMLFEFIDGIIHKKLYKMIIEHMENPNVAYLTEEDAEGFCLDVNEGILNVATSIIEQSELKLTESTD